MQEIKTVRQGDSRTVDHLIRNISETGILDAVGDGLSIQGKDYRILYQNSKSLDMLGKRVGEYCYSALDNRDSVCTACPMRRSFHDGNAHTEIKKALLRRGKLTVEVTTSVIRDSNGEIIAGMEAIKDVTRRVQLEEERNKLICDLAEAFAGVKTLKGLLPICYSCKKIRDDKGYWKKVDDYIRENSDADFTHGLCPECVKKAFPENFEDTKK